jgi:hypothetical protein
MPDRSADPAARTVVGTIIAENRSDVTLRPGRGTEQAVLNHCGM